MMVATPAPGWQWPDVHVREDGTIWRTISHGRPCTPRRVDNHDMNKGYRLVRLPDEHGRWLTFPAHRLVWIWHHGPIPEGLQVNHKNLDKGDNRIENLELVTPSGNIRHSYANGRPAPWHKATAWRGKPRITAAQAQAMRRMRAAGAMLREIAEAHGCSVSHAHRIVSRSEVQGNE